ncbi:MAG: PhzF family phenazine biosynthesis protein [Chloroherpetonaceae bacterium]|nr:PhzF family phenazine biosynthesis protein [Chloroherpetonaceae bacterium]
MSTYPIYIADAFASSRFKGNPAAVCLLEEFPEDQVLKNIAMEMNLSETAFLVPLNGGMYHLRWFTPEVEIDLCGHATLASAHILWEVGKLNTNQKASFQTRSGALFASQNKNEFETSISLDFPAIETSEAEIPEMLPKALGLKASKAHRAKFDYLIEVESEEILLSLSPDFNALRALPVRGIIVTTLSSEKNGYDFLSRFFAPASGVNEDPVTGSAHCALATYWNKRLGKTKFNAFQASKRGGEIQVELMAHRVNLSGKAFTTLKGEIIIDSNQS